MNLNKIHFIDSTIHNSAQILCLILNYLIIYYTLSNDVITQYLLS